jgi:nucleoside-diphosphate-sugar epimerase
LAESELAALADDDFSPVYLRNATVYGVSPALRLDIVVNNLTAWAIATDRIVLQSDGTPWRPQVHIEDVARAFIAVLEAPRELIHDQAFNVGRTEQNFQVRDIAEMVHDAIPDAVLEMPEVTDPDTRSYRVDFSKFASAFPDTPLEMDVARGIKELAAAFRDHDIVEASFDRYTRLREIERRIAAGEIDPSLRRAA